MSTGSMPEIRSGGTYFLGRYRVVDEIGIGGMASVHLARMDGPGGFQKWVAIKKIHPHLVEDESFVQMFLDEARVAARISHPNVATVFDLGKHEDTYWIAMEYLHGEPLREVMRRTEELGTAMPPEIACRVIADAAEGLHAAHELLGKNGEKLGLVHRDVTPHNLFVTYDGVTKVVDFGIAKFSSRMSHTRAGTLKGKLAYMSPEQVHGEGIDRRTDIFALGVVLWELTTGQRLFRMESDLDTLAKVQECNVPRPSTLIRGYPVDLEKIVMKALAKNRGERFRTARELSRALQSLLMRRGLFIASDEVAAYTQSIFADRIQKREAHLRWAAEVTQTINVDQMLSKPKLGPEFTSSEVQPSAPAPKPLPAAGMPPPRPLPAAGAPPPLPPGQMPPPGPQVLPDDAKETAGSLTTPRGPSPHKPLGRPPPAPRPAAGMPAALPPAGMDEPHPADGDGPTIQAAPSAIEDAYPPAGLSEMPTLMAISDKDRPQQRRGSNASRAEVIAPDELEEDQDETVVAKMREQQAEAGNLAFLAPAATPRKPNGPQAPGPAPSPPRPPQARFPSTGALPTGALGPAVSPLPPPPSVYGGAPAYSNEVPFVEPAAPSGSAGMGMATPRESNDFGQHALPMEGGGFPRQIPPGGHTGEFALHPPHMPADNRLHPTAPRIIHDNRTMTAHRYKRRPPMWVVAALSCSIALLIAGVVFAIISTTGNPTVVRSSTGAASAQGPFTSARNAFNAVVTVPVQPSGAIVPPPGAAPATAPDPGGAVPAPATALVTAEAPQPPLPTASAPATTTAAAPTAPGPTAARPAPAPAPLPAPVVTPKKPSPAAMGALTVVCLPKCDQIIDNGTPLGPGHIFNRPVPAGRHVLVLSAPNGVKKTMAVEVAPDTTREVRLSMDRP
jgi:serine/threonine-protein kinase